MSNLVDRQLTKSYEHIDAIRAHLLALEQAISASASPSERARLCEIIETQARYAKERMELIDDNTDAPKKLVGTCSYQPHASLQTITAKTGLGGGSARFTT